MEEFLLALVPDLQDAWKGATEDEIVQIEAIAGRPLPRFYRWFLMRMGHDMGPLGYPTADFSAPKVLECYARRQFVPNPRFLMIGHESDEMMPLHFFYDFDHSVREDARVTKSHALGGGFHHVFDTFREKLTWGTFLAFYLTTLPQCCVGSFRRHDGGDLRTALDPLMESLGFIRPIATGPNCAIYRGSRASMVTYSGPEGLPGYQTFRLAGEDSARLRRILGSLGCEPAFHVKVREWLPRLASGV
ncbi:SMI1/KNR4 family protein [Nannocystis sp. RBIL2]|uniref:SMI1/KNR4 family protein n=1 Tax=Nannocystis sp. RBIL2 TaxID=2996788 RepID=UPI0022707307|nr:SMI1/KNR4 family protein [Nannocystis sp. RBIL2]MCY1063502.1 SMI1/KNR4 family protein [Nannocystis sp. RBIL2]